MAKRERIHYLNPSDFFRRDEIDLTNVLVVVPSYGALTLETSAFLESLTMHGAVPLSAFGMSDVALHRCSIAGKARLILRKHEHLTRVFWLDSDMVGTAAHVAFLSLLLDENRTFGVPLRAVCGMYCKRGLSSVLTVRRQVDELDVTTDVVFPNAQQYLRLYPVLAGMGCLMLTREAFLASCDAAPQIRERAGQEPMPAITASGPCQDESGRWGWASEDQTYCQSLWQLGYPVYAAPIKFAHMSLVPLVPQDDAEWLNVEAESTEDVASSAEIDPPAPTERVHVAF